MVLCRDLHIDDPVAWINAVDPNLVDLWLAFYSIDDPAAKDMQDPAEAMIKLFRDKGYGI